MPIVKVGKKERFRCEEPEEVGIIERGVEEYRNSGHDVHDFVLDFFGAHSLKPSTYLNNVKRGDTTISIESWSKLKEYVSNVTR